MDNYVTFMLNGIKDVLVGQGEKAMLYINDLVEEYNYILARRIDSRRARDSHLTEAVYNPFYKRFIEIDQEIVGLVNQLWLAGIQTTNSCQDNIPEGFVWVSFKNSEEAEKFLRYIFEGLSSEDNKYRNVIVRALYSKYYYPKSWKYDINFYPWTPADNDDQDSDETILDIDQSVNIRFPKEDLEFVYNRLVNYNNQ